MPVAGQQYEGSFLPVTFNRLATPEFMDFVSRWKIDLDEVKSLEETSAEIQSLSDEAEVKQFSDRRVKLWLDRVSQLLYDAEGILDDYATELLRLKLKSECQIHPLETQQVYKIIEELQGKVRDINDRLKSVAVRGVSLGLNPRRKDPVPDNVPSTGSITVHVQWDSQSMKSRVLYRGEDPGMGSGSSRALGQRPPTSSLVNRSKIVGREEDTREILGWLLADDTPGNNFKVLPIVGAGGLGKTTLAQLAYNHENVENRFGLKAWVCVSENFNVMKLTKEILDSAIGSSPNSDSLDMLQRKLKEALSKKRLLLVLDDMWNENLERWESFSTVLGFGRRGSKILVTTRSKRVASIVRVDSEDHDYDLKCLSDKACLALLGRYAFTHENLFDADQKLKAFGEEIVKKSKGLPSAVKTLGCLLRGKKENSEWKDILENEIWESRESESRLLLPSSFTTSEEVLGILFFLSRRLRIEI